MLKIDLNCVEIVVTLYSLSSTTISEVDHETIRSPYEPGGLSKTAGAAQVAGAQYCQSAVSGYDRIERNPANWASKSWRKSFHRSITTLTRSTVMMYRRKVITPQCTRKKVTMTASSLPNQELSNSA